ncbi:hypothetical protein E2562_030746 [Oryza meyeriana var. granulata]|uniref:Uncharacterized protein n=1 Tax=Oryza meyeriana var. granulata TaxID=110450 RepID=A0A6G1E565_9ORYZ|nr:hypothetical protein E2562_030746 [Oryza meyeriana var. granulata]
MGRADRGSPQGQIDEETEWAVWTHGPAGEDNADGSDRRPQLYGGVCCQPLRSRRRRFTKKRVGERARLGAGLQPRVHRRRRTLLADTEIHRAECARVYRDGFWLTRGGEDQGHGGREKERLMAWEYIGRAGFGDIAWLLSAAMEEEGSRESCSRLHGEGWA